MINNNQASMGISTDYGIATILGNFSDDFIEDTIKESITYRFRPYGLRSPNYPEILNSRLQSVKDHVIGYEDQVEDKRVDVFISIIDSINSYYGMSIIEDIPDEQLYSLTYILYQIFVSEFTERMLNFYTQYIINNMDNILANLSIENKSTKTVYAKKIYNSEKLVTIYDNMGAAIDILASLDIPLDLLITYLSDQQVSNFICSYIGETGDVFHTGFASYINNPETRADIITNVKLKFVQATAENRDVFDAANIPVQVEN